jgi:uncharacterized protein (TIGR02996 family)
MTADQRALLAAIVADPSDDTARLAYADCIEEHGNSPRAEFIRLQVQAERLHPNSNTRAALEEQAEALFAEHWLEWWGEVCDAVGLPAFTPPQQSKGLLGRLARWALGVTPVGSYSRRGLSVKWHDPSHADSRREIGMDSMSPEVKFCRGFPESAFFGGIAPPALRNWHTASPLCQLHCSSPTAEGWDDGPHLRGVRFLLAYRDDFAIPLAALRSRYTTNLEELALAVLDFVEVDDGRIVRELAQLLIAPRFRQLKRLSIAINQEHALTVLANSPNLAGLHSLEVTAGIPGIPPGNLTVVQRLVAVFARSPHLTELREFTFRGRVDPDGFDVIFRKPAWRKLRKLEISDRFSTAGFEVLANGDDLPELEEFRAGEMELNRRRADLLDRAPLWKRLRHFSLQRQFTGGLPLSALVNAMNLDRLETFSVEVPRSYQNSSDCRQV